MLGTNPGTAAPALAGLSGNVRFRQTQMGRSGRVSVREA